MSTFSKDRGKSTTRGNSALHLSALPTRKMSGMRRIKKRGGRVKSDKRIKKGNNSERLEKAIPGRLKGNKEC